MLPVQPFLQVEVLTLEGTWVTPRGKRSFILQIYSRCHVANCIAVTPPFLSHVRNSSVSCCNGRRIIFTDEPMTGPVLHRFSLVTSTCHAILCYAITRPFTVKLPHVHTRLLKKRGDAHGKSFHRARTRTHAHERARTHGHSLVLAVKCNAHFHVLPCVLPCAVSYSQPCIMQRQCTSTDQFRLYESCCVTIRT